MTEVVKSTEIHTPKTRTHTRTKLYTKYEGQRHLFVSYLSQEIGVGVTQARLRWFRRPFLNDLQDKVSKGCGDAGFWHS